jgi:signal peptidase II
VPVRRRHNPYPALLGSAAAVFAVDQLTKQMALEALGDGPVEIVEGALTLRLAFNSGGAFGLLQGLPELFGVATLVIIVMILMWARKLDDPAALVPLGMILGGGLGNVFDRVARDSGGRVVDFIDLHVWPVFNVADSAIVAGVCLVLLLGARARARPRD